MTELTTEEKENILLTAQGLLREPASWVKRRWKCELKLRDPRDRRRLLRDDEGKPIFATDDNNEPLYQYCIHGAVNAAALRVLSRERLREFDIKELGGDGRVTFRDGSHTTLVDALDLDTVSRTLYGTDAMSFNDQKGSTREQVVEILRSGLERLRLRRKAV